MTITMREMLEAGVHFGHQTRFWNPKMAPYIYGHRNKIHIINLEKTQPLFEDAMKFVRQLASKRGTILMVGTKRQAREVIAEEARRSGMPFVDQRWLGGMLTNFKTVKGSLKKRAGRGRDLLSPSDCDTCHDFDGVGENDGPNLKGRGTQKWVAAVIADAGHPLLFGDRNKMPKFRGKLTQEEIDDLAKFVIGQKAK